jgi:hypothetical protein
MFILRREKKTMKQRGHLPIYQRIVESTSCEMHVLWEKYSSEKSEPICIRTDCLTLTYPKQLPPFGPVPFGAERLEPSLKLIDSNPSPPEEFKPWVPPKREWTIFETNDLDEAVDMFAGEFKQNACVVGLGGYGKSELQRRMLEAYLEGKHPAKLFTSVNMVKAKFASELKDPDVANTLESALNTRGACDGDGLPSKEEREKYLKTFKPLKDGHVLVDEISNISTRHWVMLADVKKIYPNMTFLLSGDPENQNVPIEKYFEPLVNALDSPLVYDLCRGNLIRLTYNPELSRYDPELHKLVDEFIKTGQVPSLVENKSAAPLMVIGKFSEKGNTQNNQNDEMNEKYLEMHPKRKRYELLGTQIIQGTPVFANVNEKDGYDNLVSRSERFYFQGFFQGLVVFTKGENTYLRTPAYFNRYFVLGWYATNFKIQGQTITEPFEIIDINYMNRREFFTAITRAKTVSQISYAQKYVGKELRDVVPRYGRVLTQTEVSTMYLRAKIYRIKNEKLKMEYIGQTCCTKEKRHEQHKENPSNKAIRDSKMMIDSTIEILEEWPCLTERCILEREAYWIRKRAQEIVETKSDWKLMNVSCNDKKSANRYFEKRKVEMTVEVTEIKQIVKTLPWKIEHTPRYRKFYWCLGQRKKDEESITEYEKGQAAQGLAEIKQKRLARAQNQFGKEYTFVFPEDPDI